MLVDEYFRSIAWAYSDRLLRFADGIAATRDELGGEWAAVGDLSDWMLELTPEEADEVSRRVHAVLDEYRMTDPQRARAEGTERVVVQLQVMPTVTRGGVTP